MKRQSLLSSAAAFPPQQSNLTQSHRNNDKWRQTCQTHCEGESHHCQQNWVCFSRGKEEGKKAPFPFCYTLYQRANRSARQGFWGRDRELCKEPELPATWLPTSSHLLEGETHFLLSPLQWKQNTCWRLNSEIQPTTSSKSKVLLDIFKISGKNSLQPQSSSKEHYFSHLIYRNITSGAPYALLVN